MTHYVLHDVDALYKIVVFLYRFDFTRLLEVITTEPSRIDMVAVLISYSGEADTVQVITIHPSHYIHTVPIRVPFMSIISGCG